MKIFIDINKLKYYLKNEGKYNKNYVLPLSTIHLSQVQYTIGIKTLYPTLDVIDIFSNKQRFADYVKKHNLSNHFPKIYTSQSNASDVVVVKPKYGGASHSVYFTELKNVKQKDFENNTVQEYIDSHIEFAGYFVAKNGKIVHSFAYYREYPPGKRYIKNVNDTSVQKRTEVDANCISVIEKFVKPVNFTGPFCVDFKYNQNGLVVLEINARLGASLSYPQNINDAAAIVNKLIEINN
jgi:carbamoylphosphate synthase large subunit